MLAAAIADELARKRRSSSGPIAVPPIQQPGNLAPSLPCSQPVTTLADTTSRLTADRPRQRTRRYTPYGPIPIKFGQTLGEQITEIQREHHKVASHDYFLTAPEDRGKVEGPKQPTGIWGFDNAEVERFPVLRKRNFFCIQHHSAYVP